jgi:predicted ribonuclease toxin of YeeF-YezG toxin-antitoxin module
MFSDVNKSKVIEAWKDEAILAAYKEWYIPIAAILYRNTKSRKDPQEIAKSSVTKKVKDFYKEHDMENPGAACEEFFKSREYVLKLEDSLKIFYEWNEIAYVRSRKPYKKYEGVGRKPIGQTAYAIEKMEQRRKNIKKAKELKEAGMSVRAIAMHLGVKEPCVLAYLRT